MLSVRALPGWLRRLWFGLLRGSTARVRFAGRICATTVHIHRGIKQGCPTSGLLRALLLGPIVRRVEVAESIPASISFFAVDVVHLFMPELLAGRRHRPRTDIADEISMLRLWPAHAICLDAIWRYLFYKTYAQACADGHRWDREDVALALRGQMRSLATRSPGATVRMGWALAPGRAQAPE